MSTITLVFGSLFLSVQNVNGNTVSTTEGNSEWLPPEIDREKYEALLDELGLEKDIPFNEDIPPEVLEKMSNSKVLNEMAQSNNVNNAIVPSSIKVIKLGKSIK